ncbi:hypothetical protein [Bradyrhizobium sp. CCGE-LA001]|uniref:hypothetical protein n=1 Tax=Bradyrhizobium sp. CCGE-LA001 TaxID=1223566 RepID=UPI000745E2FC|nr:hypothetical protein [Bradyrhizobium sp. CCGE-LA001]AMA55378.1 hypothetical protein BCCGELA001_03220 [Bradyrhizobium sp. CCGE-LA001]
MNLPQEPDLLIEKDADGVIRELRHLQTPAVGDPDVTAKRAAFEYLTLASHTHPPLLPLSDDDLEHLDRTSGPGERARSSDARFAWAKPRELKRNDRLETTIVWVQQTVPIGNSKIAVDVEGSSIRLVVHRAQASHRPLITSVRSTTLKDPELPVHANDVEDVLGGLKQEWADELKQEVALELLRSVLGLGRPIGVDDLRILAYERERATVGRSGKLGLALSAAIFMPVASGDSIAHRVLVDLPSLKPVRKTPILSACAGYAFLSDPASKTGGFKLRPDSLADLLDHERDPVGLLDLDHAGGGRRKLSGPRVTVLAPAALGDDYDPPVQRPPFAFTARTNEFAAVSAYCHCDSMMQLVQGFGFVLKDYFGKVALPLTVEHRAKMLTGSGAHDGRGINAYVTPFRADQMATEWDVRMLFGLADFADTWKHPLGLVADVRFVWHEFCHVLILAATGSTEFDFAHSAGDALGAIMCDPASKLPKTWRGVTFPFIQLPLRRHDRDVTKGWGWNGTLYEKPNPTYGPRDPVGYNSEQILSSTLFQLYLASGGDAVRPDEAPDVDARTAAAYYIAYLVVRAIASLGSVATQPTREAGQFATALMDADVGTPYLDYDGSRRLGGMLHKVVRWAFERQGLYQASSAARVDEPGSPPPIDIYVDDGRGGQYKYCKHWHALPAVFWVRNAADGQRYDQTPRPGYVNYVYVKLGNRGAQIATAASVDVSTVVGNHADTWDTDPNHWSPVNGNNTTTDVSPGEPSAIFGPFEWTPQAGKRNALLVRATVAGDRSNIDTGSTLPVATGPVTVADLVRTDNNLGYREWTL